MIIMNMMMTMMMVMKRRGKKMLVIWMTKTDDRHDDGDNGVVNDGKDDGNGANKDPTSPSVAFHQIVGKMLPAVFNSFYIVWEHTHDISRLPCYVFCIGMSTNKYLLS